MHPRERVKGLAKLISEKGGTYPQTLQLEALRLGIELPEIKPQYLTPEKTKEKPDGSKQQN
jgi:hypothetical protein|tara:strand:- start:5694 stop:5876 length:183 start_codon:yes stop_codon:yes gene_type:complete